MKNKRGSGLIIVVVLLALIVLIGGGIWIATGTGERVVRIEETGVPSPLTCADSTGILTINDRSAIAGGTDPGSPAFTCGIDGGAVTTSVTSGTTTFAIGANLECISVIDDYIDESYTFTMPCGGKTLDAPMYYATSDNPGIRIKNDDDNFMTNDVSGGATNQTDLTAGETLILEVEFQGTNTESSGDGIWVIEFPASSGANITSITLDGKNPISVPTVHTLQNAASKGVAFDVSAIVGAEKRSYTLSINLGSGKDLAGGVYTDWYAKQKFIDDDKTIQYGVEDSDGTVKYENTLDFDFYIDAS